MRLVLASLTLAGQWLRCPVAAEAADLAAVPPNAAQIEAFWDSLMATTRQALGGTPGSRSRDLGTLLCYDAFKSTFNSAQI